MGRSWRKFFKRSEKPEERSGAAVNTLEQETGAAEGTPPPEDAEAALEPVDESVDAPKAEPIVSARDLEGEAAKEAVEEEAGGRWFSRLRQGLRKSRESFVGQLNAAVAEFRDTGDEEFWEKVEEILITSDVGVSTTAKLVAELEQEALERNITNGKELRELMIRDATKMLDKPVELDISHKPTVILMVGVNGTGKTTTIGKIAWHLQRELGRSVILAAGDTYRAAAVEQLVEWAGRAGCDIVTAEQGSDPGAVAYDAIAAARARGHDVVICDTAGRLHTQHHLMEELAKVRRVISKQIPDAPHETLLTIDATTGQNGLRQAMLFREAVDVTGIVLTKLDGTAKGGIALAIAQELGVPVKLIGIGEALEDLRPFDPDDFARALLEA
jgi:fused signal recognition particle receptor